MVGGMAKVIVFTLLLLSAQVSIVWKHPDLRNHGHRYET
mgnify:CR=1 FL=1